MQYSMNDHKNQPNKKSSGKMYLWIGMEKSGNTHTHTDNDTDIYTHGLDTKIIVWLCVYTNKMCK